MFAALNSVEPSLEYYADLEFFPSGEPWAGPRRDAAESAVRGKLAALEQWLGAKDYLEGRFSAGDLLMTTVLRNLRTSEILSGYSAVSAYRQRCEARPAFKQAMADHLRPFLTRGHARPARLRPDHRRREAAKTSPRSSGRPHRSG